MASEVRTTFRDHFLSIYQSAAADYLRKAQAAPPTGLEAAAGSPTAIANAADRVAQLHADGLAPHADAAAPPGAGPQFEGIADTATTCAALGMQYLEAKAFGDEVTAARLEGELSQG